MTGSTSGTSISSSTGTSIGAIFNFDNLSTLVRFLSHIVADVAAFSFLVKKSDNFFTFSCLQF